jgi:glutathione reductase (NADPH)
MSSYDYDLFVIGAGSGGVRASRIAAAFGARVGIAENSRIGGTCVIRGCIPKKLLVYGAAFAEEFEDSRGFGWEMGAKVFSWPKLIGAKNREVDRLNGIYIRLLQGSGVEIIEARATFEDAHTVRLGDRLVRAKYILIATGGWPSLPAIPGIEHAITSNEALDLPALPERIAIVGGGYIAAEFAGIFHGLGAKTAVIYRGPQILRGFDDDVRSHLGNALAKKGIDLRLNAEVATVLREPSGALQIGLVDGGSMTCDQILYATGRAPNTAALGLDRIGVMTDAKGHITVDRYGQTNLPHIYAIGDAISGPALTPVAIREGQAVATTLFGGRPMAFDREHIPTAVFSQPPVATVGLSEQEARRRFAALDIYKTSFRPLKYTLSGRDEQTFMKLVVDAASDRVLGAHMVGPDAAEIIQGLAIPIKMGATKAAFDATVGIHPTAAEEFVTLREKWNPPAEAAD